MEKVDPFQLEIIRNVLVAAAEEMSVAIWRTSRSTVVRELLDFSTAIFDPSGDNVAQATRIPIHLNSMATCLADILADDIPISQWCDGDVIITNDPYRGGQHLPDILTFRPVFLDGEMIAITGALCHHIDVGGGAAGSFYAKAEEIYHEGLRIPPVKIVQEGVRNDALFDVILQNSREPEKIGGDLSSQLASLEVGAAGVLRMARRYGVGPLRDAMARILDQSEQALRAALRAMPDGVYDFEDFVDNDGIDDTPVRIHAVLTIDGDHAAVDFSASSPQARGPVNCTLNMTKSAVYFAIMAAAGADIAANSGCYRPISITAPKGLIVNCRHPAPVANRMATGHRIANTMMGALSKAVPERMPAAYYGVSYVYSLGVTKDDGSQDVYFDLEVGGWGGHPERDGANGFSAGFHNISNSPMEMIESLYPVMFVAYGYTPDSGGAGRFRGGLGIHREWRLDAEEGVLSANLDRFKFPPYGLSGGKKGSASRLLVRQNGETIEADAKLAGKRLHKGDQVRLETSGGGGWGDASKRSDSAIKADIEEGFVTPEGAARDYGWKNG
ncbi:MAG: N-methylhydantoinase B [Alphaproteobacteria bacterium]|jgi:N-methylhydantoinase B